LSLLSFAQLHRQLPWLRPVVMGQHATLDARAAQSVENMDVEVGNCTTLLRIPIPPAAPDTVLPPLPEGESMRVVEEGRATNATSASPSASAVLSESEAAAVPASTSASAMPSESAPSSATQPSLVSDLAQCTSITDLFVFLALPVELARAFDAEGIALTDLPYLLESDIARLVPALGPRRRLQAFLRFHYFALANVHE
jgi:hypothetical protein